MYYHVYIELKEKDKKGNPKKLYEFNKKDLNEIKNDIIKPYLLNQEFLFKGTYITKKEVNQFLIKNSSNDINQIIKTIENIRSKNSLIILGYFVNKEDVFFNDKYCIDITTQIFKEVEKKISQEKNQIEKNTPLDKSKVFIVHGHDDLAKNEVARFIEKLGFEAIILHEQASSGKTIIEKIEEYSNVGFGIVLYTPCDIGAKKDENPNLKPRARQNVVFEHGFLIGKIGRSNVCALVKDSVEKPNDISGIVYISMESHWQIDLAKEMEKSDYNIDFNKIFK